MSPKKQFWNLTLGQQCQEAGQGGRLCPQEWISAWSWEHVHYHRIGLLTQGQIWPPILFSLVSLCHSTMEWCNKKVHHYPSFWFRIPASRNVRQYIYFHYKSPCIGYSFSIAPDGLRQKLNLQVWLFPGPHCELYVLKKLVHQVTFIWYSYISLF